MSKKMLKRSLALALSFVLLISLLPSDFLPSSWLKSVRKNLGIDVAQAADENPEVYQGYVDYTQYMKSHELTVNGDTIKNNSTINPEKDFSLSLGFSMDLSDMGRWGLKYFYRLPEHITIGDRGTEASPLVLYNNRGVAIGTYFIKDDVIFVTFPGYYDSVYTNFSMEASWEDTANRTEINVDWNGTSEHYFIDVCDLQIMKNAPGGIRTAEDGSYRTKFQVRVYPKSTAGEISNVTFKDAYNGPFDIVTDLYGEGKAIKLTMYSSNKEVLSEKYYDATQVSVTNGNTKTITITPIDMAAGAYFVVEYEVVLPTEKRMSYDATNGTIAYTNRAEASYPYYEAATGETKILSVNTSIDGRKESSSEWIMKSAGDDTKTKVINGDQKTIIPYTLQMNRHRAYSLGGSVVNDEISNYTSDANVVYDTSKTSGTKVIATDSTGTTEIAQTWVTLDADTYAALDAIVAKTQKRQLQVLRENAALTAKLLAAIQATDGSIYTEFTDEAAAKYVFTESGAHNFIWFMPMDSEPTSYMIYYYTIVDSTVGDFNNTASLWYTELEGVPAGPGGSWTKPVKKVLTSSKTNEGIYIGADGNYYVDYTMTVGVAAGSAGFDRIYLVDIFPTYNVTIDGKSITLVDWLCGLDADDKNPRDMIKALTITTDCDDPLLQYSLAHAFTGIHVTNDTAYFYSNNYDSNCYSYVSPTGSSATLYGAVRYQTQTTAPAGQFVAELDEKSKHLITTSVDSWRAATYCWKGMTLYIGDLPGSDVGYDVTIKYTMQINPLLIEMVPEILETKSLDYITCSNTLAVNQGRYTTSTRQGNYAGMYELRLTQSYGYTLQSATTKYWLSINKSLPFMNKDVAGYDENAQTLAYTVDINDIETESSKAEAENSTYTIHDALNISGMKYVPNSFTLTDDDGKIIFTNESGKSADSYYGNIGSITMTDSDTEANSVCISLDNAAGKLNDANNKYLKTMHLSYKVNVAGVPTDSTIQNTVNLQVECYDAKKGISYNKVLGQDTCEYVIDQAVSKKMLADQVPNVNNNYNAGYSIDIDPTSGNAKELAALAAGEKFTVVDTMSSNLVPDLESVTVYRIGANDVKTDITADCQTTFSTASGKLSVEITKKDAASKYQIVYKAQIVAPVDTLAIASNEVEILGTSITVAKTEDKVYIVEYTDEAGASSCKIRLKKYDGDDASKGLQAKFELYYYNTSTKKWVKLNKTIETDADGYALIENPTVAADSELDVLVKVNTLYKLVEIEVEDGYFVDSTPIYYYVSKDGDYAASTKNLPTGVTEYEFLAVPEISADIEEADYPMLLVENRKPGLAVTKSDYISKAPMSGITFTLYRDENCTTQVAQGVTDEEGYVEFLGLDGNTTYYLKETGYPDGYATPQVVKLQYVDDKLSSATYLDGTRLTVDVENKLSHIAIENKKLGGYLEVTKKLSASDTKEVTESEFSFSVILYDKNGAMEESKSYPAIKVDAKGNETETTYTTGTMFSLKSGETLRLCELPVDYTYQVTEQKLDYYDTTYSMVDSLNNKQSNQKGTVCKGKIDDGGLDTVTFFNVKRGDLIVEKICVDENGFGMDIPDGLTITVCTATQDYVIAAYSANDGKFNVVELLDDSIEVENTENGGLWLKHVPSTTYLVKESNFDIEGYGVISKLYCTVNGREYLSDGITLPAKTAYGTVVEATLKNTYSTGYLSFTPEITKVYEGAELEAGQFTFNVYEKKNYVWTLIGEATNDAEGKLDLSFMYSSANIGTHQYYVTEKRPSEAKYSYGKYVYQGTAYDSGTIYFNVVVKADADNNLTATANGYYSNSAMTTEKSAFTNTYSATGSLTLRATKTVLYKYQNAKTYSFTLTETESDYETPILVNGVAKTYTAQNAGYVSAGMASDVKFPAISFTSEQVGTHYYIMQEVIPENAVDGIYNNIKYDTHIVKIAVEVSDRKDGTLDFEVTYPDGEAAFVNEYTAKGTITLSGTKTINDKDIAEGEYSFELTEYTTNGRTTKKTDENNEVISYTATTAAAALNSQTKKAVADIVFPEISYGYGDIGFHYYILTETVGSAKGVTYTTKQYPITIQVSDASNGRLTVSRVGSYNGTTGALSFENTYSLNAKVTFSGTKTIVGREFTDTDSFHFVAKVTKTDANRVETVVQSNMSLGFADKTGITEDGSVANIQYPELTFTQKDIGCIYTFEISEVASAAGTNLGITNSTEKVIVQVAISKDADGNLVADVSYGNADAANFVNTYRAEGSIAFTATKALLGRTLAANQFSFGIYENGVLVGNAVKNAADGTITFDAIEYVLESAADGTITSDVGEHTYVIKEIIPSEREKVNGYTYDETEYTVKVTVSDNGDGTLAAVASEGATANGSTYAITSTADSTFTNTYKATGDVTFAGTKTINAGTILDDEFEFTVVEYKGADDSKTATGRTFTAYVKADGTIEFPQITYTKENGTNQTGTFSYEITEVQGDRGGVTYSDETLTVMVLVEDNGAGKLVATPSMNYNQLSFANTYNASGSVSLHPTKVLMGREIVDYEFYLMASFTEYDENGDVVISAPATLFAYVKADGTFSFGPTNSLVYNEENIDHTFVYVISEYLPEGDTLGVTYSEEAYTVTVTVADDRDGNLTVVATTKNAAGETLTTVEDDGSDAEIAFVNSYDAKGALTVMATKILGGREIEDGQFTFGIFEDDEEVATATNVGNQITFPEINFYIDGSEDGVEKYIGEHTYTIIEIVNEEADGYTYSDESYTFTVKALDNGDGTIRFETVSGATLTEDGTGVTVDTDKASNFYNSYEAQGWYTFTGEKFLNGLVIEDAREIEEGEFTFTIVEKKLINGEYVTTGRTFSGSVAEGGAIAFEDISYLMNDQGNDVGTGIYSYTITENAGTRGGVTYSKEQYLAVIEVSDRGDGVLVPELTSLATVEGEQLEEAEEITFTNLYEAYGSLIVNITKLSVTEAGAVYEDVKNNIFKFEIYDVTDETEDITDTLDPIYVGEAKAGEKVQLGELQYSLEDVGTYRYKIIEVQTDAAGFTFDETVYYVTVEVEDGGEGVLNITVTDEESKEVITSKEGVATYDNSFTNIYAAVGSAVFKGVKQVEHLAEMIANNELVDKEFEFAVVEMVKDEDGNVAEIEVGDAYSLADGSIEFPEISYHLEDVGMHIYRVTEKTQHMVSGMMYQTEPVYVRVIVANNGDGTLNAEVAYMANVEDWTKITKETTSEETEAQFLNIATEISIWKRDDKSNALAGAKLRITDKDGNTVYEFISGNGPEVVYGLSLNELYYLVEVEAPNGYEFADSIGFMVSEDGTITIVNGSEKMTVEELEMVDAKVKTPTKTGDFLKPAMVILGLLSGIAAFVLVWRRRRQRA